MIVIIDYGMGNLGSIANMLKKVGAQAKISSAIADIEAAKQLILPGVGSFDNGMNNLKDRGFLPVLHRRVLEEKTPVLGICLGMQLLTRSSEEGELPGLGWIDADTVRFRFDSEGHNLKVPHMGWNYAHPTRPGNLFDGAAENEEEDPRFYFVHSYHVVCRDEADVLTSTQHGYAFTSSVQRENIVGVQFHPEKSHKYGMALLQRFALNAGASDR